MISQGIYGAVKTTVLYGSLMTMSDIIKHMFIKE